jgi:hypothetical protein
LIDDTDGGEEWLQKQSSAQSNNRLPISVDGVEVMVGENLAIALRTMREIPEVRSGMGLWVSVSTKLITARNVWR